MSTISKKRLATVAIILILVFGYVLWMYVKQTNGKSLPAFIGIIFAFVLALGIHAIWNKKAEKEKQ